MKIAYITDSGTGCSIDEMAKEKIFSLPLQIEVEGKNYFDLEQISNEDILTNLVENKKMSTSLPSLGLIDNLFSQIKKEGFDKVIAVPICSGLSGTINALNLSAKDHNIAFEYLDCYVTAKLEEYIIKYLRSTITDKGIEEKLAFDSVNKIIDSANTLLIPNDLMHLSKSGRLTPLAAGIGNFFNIKPILKVNKETNGKIDVVTKTRTFKKALNKVIEIMKNDITSDDYVIYIAHVKASQEAINFKSMLSEIFINNKIEIIPLCNPVALHTGLGCLAIQYFKKLND